MSSGTLRAMRKTHWSNRRSARGTEINTNPNCFPRRSFCRKNLQNQVNRWGRNFMGCGIRSYRNAVVAWNDVIDQALSKRHNAEDRDTFYWFSGNFPESSQDINRLHSSWHIVHSECSVCSCCVFSGMQPCIDFRDLSGIKQDAAFQAPLEIRFFIFTKTFHRAAPRHTCYQDGHSSWSSSSALLVCCLLPNTHR